MSVLDAVGQMKVSVVPKTIISVALGASIQRGSKSAHIVVHLGI